METSRRRLFAVIAASSVVVMLVGVVFFLREGDQVTAPQYTHVVICWRAPTTGAVPVTYLVRIQEPQAATEDTFTVAAVPGERQCFTFTQARVGHDYRACTAGVDARDRQGPWSGWSPAHHGGAADAAP